MQDCNVVTTRMIVGGKLYAGDNALFDRPPMYRSVIRGLQYLTLTRPDFSYSMNKLS